VVLAGHCTAVRIPHVELAERAIDTTGDDDDTGDDDTGDDDTGDDDTGDDDDDDFDIGAGDCLCSADRSSRTGLAVLLLPGLLLLRRRR